MLGNAGDYGLFNKGRWSRKARVADALDLVRQQEALDDAEAEAKARRELAVAKELASHGAGIQEKRDKLFGFEAEGDVKRMQRDRAAASLPSKMKVDEITGQAETDEALAHKIAAGTRLARTPSLASGTLNKEQAQNQAAIEAATFAQQNPGIAYQLEALKTMGQAETARELGRLRRDATLGAARVRAGVDEDGNPLSGDPLYAGSKSGRINLQKAAEMLQKQSSTVNAPQETAVDSESLGLLQKLLKEKFGYELPQLSR